MNGILYGINEKRVHFIGIGGISMSALAKYLSERGYTVSGSDAAVNEEVTKLEELGVRVTVGHSADAVTGAQAVVYTDAIKADKELR